jgi:hypothetical protein
MKSSSDKLFKPYDYIFGTSDFCHRHIDSLVVPIPKFFKLQGFTDSVVLGLAQTK